MQVWIKNTSGCFGSGVLLGFYQVFIKSIASNLFNLCQSWSLANSVTLQLDTSNLQPFSKNGVTFAIFPSMGSTLKAIFFICFVITFY